MDKNQKLPGQVLKLLSDNSITPDSIIAVSASDMNTECEYADGYVVLTASRLAVITSPADAAEVHSFKGYISKNTISEKPKDWAIRLYDTEKIERLICEPLVACSLLVAVMKDETSDGNAEKGDPGEGKTDNRPAGISLRLTAFSNLHRESMHRLTRSFDRLKNPEQDKIFIPDEEDNDFCPICGMMYPNKNRKICPKCMDRKSDISSLMRGILRSCCSAISRWR